MILLTLTSGSITKRLCNKTEKSKGGYDNGSYFFAPEITSFSDVDFEGLPFVSVRAGNITCEYKEVASLTAEEVTATLQIWDEYTETSPITVFEGKALRTDIVIEEDDKFRESVFVTYRLRTDMDELETDLLSSAYDLKQLETDSSTYTTNRVTPMNFGYVKHATGFLLSVSCTSGCGGIFSSDGKTLKTYDAGIEGNHTQSASATEIIYNPTTGRAPVYGLTQDIDATDTTSASVTVNPAVIPVQAALTIANTALKTNQGGTDYIAYSVDADGVVSFSIDTSGNLKSAGIIQHINGNATTATRLTVNGAYISSQTSVDATHRTSYALTKDGQSHWYFFNTTTNLWAQIASSGVSTISSDDYILTAQGSAYGAGVSGGYFSGLQKNAARFITLPGATGTLYLPILINTTPITDIATGTYVDGMIGIIVESSIGYLSFSYGGRIYGIKGDTALAVGGTATAIIKRFK